MTYPKTFDGGAFTIAVVPSTQFFQSYDRDGHAMIYSATEEECIDWSRAYLKAQQEGWPGESRVMNKGLVGGKL